MAHLKDLTPDPANRRAHNARNLGMLTDSLHAVGAARSIVIDEDNVILAGNGVVEAAAEAGIENVQIVEADGNTVIAVRRRGLSDEQKRALALYDNRVAELATWNVEQLKLDAAAGLNLQPFWTETERAKLLGMATAGRSHPDDVPAQRSTDIRAGDLFELGPHRLLCGDSTKAADVARVLRTDRPEMILTDPPYCSGGFQEAGRAAGSVGRRGDHKIANDTLSTRGFIALIKSALGNLDAGVIYVFTDWRMWVNLFDVAESSGYGVRNMIVWDKGTPGLGRGWRAQHELVLCASRVSSPFDPHVAQGNVIRCERTGNEHHATEKPVELLAAILTVTDFAEVVVDPFCGSGSTLIAAEQVGRRFVGLDLEPACVQIAIDRWETFTGNKAIKVGEPISEAGVA
jgi:DNA modification methylase